MEQTIETVKNFTPEMSEVELSFEDMRADPIGKLDKDGKLILPKKEETVH